MHELTAVTKSNDKIASQTDNSQPLNQTFLQDLTSVEVVEQMRNSTSNNDLLPTLEITGGVQNTSIIPEGLLNNGNEKPCPDEDSELSELNEDVKDLGLDECTEEIALDLLEALKGGKDSYILDNVGAFMKKHAHDPNLKDAIEAVNKVLKEHGPAETMELVFGGSLKLSHTTTVHPDGSNTVLRYHGSPASPAATGETGPDPEIKCGLIPVDFDFMKPKC